MTISKTTILFEFSNAVCMVIGSDCQISLFLVERFEVLLINLYFQSVSPIRGKCLSSDSLKWSFCDYYFPYLFR